MQKENLLQEEEAVTAVNESQSKLDFSSSKIFTLPNFLSILRILLVPIIIYLYCIAKEYLVAGILVLISGITDIVDGVIARRFNMISDLGKILDTIADKLTQLSVMVCLVIRFPNFLIPVIALVVKEVVAGVTGLLRIKRTNKVHSADWHGKITTVLLYLTMVLHIFWYDINIPLSNVLIAGCTGMILLSGVIYAITNITIFIKGK